MVVVSVELVEVDVLSLMVGIFFARRVEQAHATDVLLVATVRETSLQVGIGEWIVVGQRHFVDMVGV